MRELLSSFHSYRGRHGSYEHHACDKVRKMSTFDKIIGYDSIKEELLMIVDMIRNRDRYSALGASLPKGVILYGKPGLGKSMLAKSFVEECGLKPYILRRNTGSNNFVDVVTKTFEEAKENAPSVILLDDMDKYANDDSFYSDAEEYVAVQSGIDEVYDSEVFVIATVNNIDKLPESLVRPGRFDKKIEVLSPTDKDAEAIIEYYLSDKKLDPAVNMEDLTRMISYSSCAELQTLINEAAIYAAYDKKDSIEMSDIVRSVLRMQYKSPDNYTRTSDEQIKKTALHEAGHLVVAEVLQPGSVGMASLRAEGRDDVGGFVHMYKEIARRPHDVMVALAGKAAVELYYSESCAGGCQQDLKHAVNGIRSGLNMSGTRGLGMVDVSIRGLEPSESYNSKNEAVTQAELESYLFKTRNIILKNRSFLEATAKALCEKKTLLYSDIKKIKEESTVCEISECFEYN